jgi:hypothetical protein
MSASTIVSASSIVSASTLVSALDQLNNNQYGENNHIEYAWSEIQQEKILQLSFQLVRTSDPTRRYNLANKFKECFQNGSIEDRKILIKLLAHTRDIEEGKGEYALSFAIIKALSEYEVYREMCVELMCNFVGVSSNSTKGVSQKPMGSWKDMKYLFNELQSCPTELIDIINTQLREDINDMNNNKPCSLLAKWIPREKSKKFGWIHKFLARNYFECVGWGASGWNKGATNKAQTYYRKVVSTLNRYIDTVQVKQCGQVWKTIDFDKVTSITMMKQRKSFLNDKTLNDNDRIICRQHLLDYMEQVKEGTKEIKGRRTSMIDFIKAALQLKNDTDNNNTDNNNTDNDTDNDNENNNNNDEHERFLINEAWKNNSKDTKSLENMIAMVDTSGSMESENSQPLYSAMGLGIRVAEKSKLGKRIMTFDTNPTWLNLEGCKDFVEEVHTVRNAGWGMNTNFHKAMDLILDQIKVNRVPAEEVENLVLVVFSDMQFDAAERNEEQLFEQQQPPSEHVRQILKRKFHDAGIEICGKGYKMPHILFWNLRSTDGFPELSYQDNVTMLSGYSPMLLNSFLQEGMAGLKDATPWNMLLKMLDNERYNHLEDLVK